MSLSYWEKDAFLTYDVLIIGSGIIGLSTACSLLEKNPGLRVAVLERGLLPSGASTRNAGFACFGSLTEIMSDLEKMPPEEVLRLIRMRAEGLHILRSRLGDQAIDYQQFGGYELLFENQDISPEKIRQINELLQPLFNTPVFSFCNEKISGFGFNSQAVHAMLFNPLEGQLHSGKMMYSLLQRAAKLGALVFTGCQVMRLEEWSNGMVTTVRNPMNGDMFNFRSAQAIICTNAFAREFFPEMDINPGRGQVILTEPIQNLPFRGTFHAEEGYYYFRNIDDRVLLGGGRHLDFEGETTTDFGPNDRIVFALRKMLDEVILPGIPHTIDMHWTGIMAFGQTKMPVVRRVSNRIIAGVRMGGMGVALGSGVGEQLAQIALS